MHVRFCAFRLLFNTPVDVRIVLIVCLLRETFAEPEYPGSLAGALCA